MRVLLIPAVLLMIAGLVSAQHDHGHEEAYFDSGSSDDASDWLASGESYEFTFDVASGAFEYHCHPHPWMTGTVVVEGHSADQMDEGMSMEPQVHEVRIVEGNATDIDSWVYEPETVTIKLGDTVRWINDGAMQHTVTAEDAAPHSHAHESPGIGVMLLVAIIGVGAAGLRRIQ